MSKNSFCLVRYMDHLEFNINGPIITKDFNINNSKTFTKQCNFYIIKLEKILFTEIFSKQLSCTKLLNLSIYHYCNQFIFNYFFNWLGYLQLVDLTVIDKMNNIIQLVALRWEIIYQLLSIHDNYRLSFRIISSKPQVNSIYKIYPNSNWLEREIFDLYGIFFWGHPDLRRILTDYGFEHFPFRKDFPLNGYTEIRFDEELNQIVTEPINLSQNFRSFNFLNPWEKRDN